MIKAAILITLMFAGGIIVGIHMDEPHQYTVQVIDVPQTDGTVAHDYARVDLSNGTMCSLTNSNLWVNRELVLPCTKADYK